jgi:hypothetical protein
MCELAVSYADWLMISKTEFKIHKVDHAQAITTFRDHLISQVPFLKNGNFLIFWLSGADTMSVAYRLPPEIVAFTVQITVSKEY